MADIKITDMPEISVPSLEDLLYLIDDPAVTPLSRKVSLARMLGLLNICQGRLTLETNQPTSASDQVAKSNLYFTPFNGNQITLFDGTRWKLYKFTEVTLALTGLTADKNYYVYIYDNAGTLTLELSAAWSADNVALALDFQDGVLVKDDTPTRRFLGAIRTTGTTTTEDSLAKRFVWNAMNQVQRTLRRVETTASWSLTGSSVFRQANGAAANKVEFILGRRTEIKCELVARVTLTSNTGECRAGVGFNGTTWPADGLFSGAQNAGSSAMMVPMYASYSGIVGAGFHYFAWLEFGATGGTCVFTGNAGGGALCGLLAHIYG